MKTPTMATNHTRNGNNIEIVMLIPRGTKKNGLEVAI